MTVNWWIQVESTNGKPAPTTRVERCCQRCGASFLGLAPGRTGEAGVWDQWRWYCSLECAPPHIRAALEAARG